MRLSTPNPFFSRRSRYGRLLSKHLAGDSRLIVRCPWMTEALRLTKTHLVPLTAEVALDCAELPADFHGDPADRIIASTARTNALVLFTHDTKLLSLARKGYLRAERV